MNKYEKMTDDGNHPVRPSNMCCEHRDLLLAPDSVASVQENHRYWAHHSKKCVPLLFEVY